jgi:hypothetical protein
LKWKCNGDVNVKFTTIGCEEGNVLRSLEKWEEVVQQWLRMWVIWRDAVSQHTLAVSKVSGIVLLKNGKVKQD